MPAAGPVVVVGFGMAAHRLVQELVERGVAAGRGVVVVGEEEHPGYDRVHLTRIAGGSDPSSLYLPGGWPDDVEVVLGQRVVAVDLAARTVRTDAGRELGYGDLVLATGSEGFVPPVADLLGDGTVVYRRIDDVLAMRHAAASVPAGAPAVVVGGGLLGLEAAGALTSLGLRVTVVEVADRLLAQQVDVGGGAVLRRLVETGGIRVVTGSGVAQVRREDGALTGVVLADGTELAARVVVVSAGIRPRDDLGRTAGLTMGERGGILVDDACRTSAPRVWAIGECACAAGRCWGLVAPAYDMAVVVADRLAGGTAVFTEADTATELKMLGVPVASAGDVHGTTPGALELVWADHVGGVYKKLVVSEDGRRLLGAVLVGDTESYGLLRALVGGELPGAPEQLVLPAVEGRAGDVALPDAALLCTYNAVSVGAVRDAVRCGDACDVPSAKGCTRAGTTCGSCVPLLKKVVESELVAAGGTVSAALCEHFAYSRQELYSLVRLRGLRTFSQVVGELGTGRGCDICKPLVASLLATLAPAHPLDGENAATQDTNDWALANLQKDGTYSVVPRLPAGEVTPAKLAVIAQVAADFGLYTKITGAQRIDLFGARLDQLPQIWQRLVDAGMESGHAYGKSLRTVKSCVGDTWCRFGVQDSVAMAVRLELRYRGLRSPHKLKSAVSGCARECAEARGKDFGVIATESGWNLYLGGNGGFTPRHADLFATDLTDDELIRCIDRFLMLYIRTADRLQRTSTWIESLEGGMDYLRSVIVDDALGICAELDADMAAHVAKYEDEWAATLADPERLARFVPFLNAPGAHDPNVVRVPERGQSRPIRDAERRPRREVLVAGPALPVGAP
ncbi:MAG TPA: nitrite reductase large subunit NirB [Mycobacteriales bacterium]|nr:nitrite reductase large subunit NirB [Mycobacteriales bacterium]